MTTPSPRVPGPLIASTRPRIAWVSALVLAATVSCSRSPTPATAAVTVIESGAEPRRHPDVDAAIPPRIDLTVLTTITLRDDVEGDETIATPPVEFTLSFTSEESATERKLSFRIDSVRVGDGGSDPEVTANLKDTISRQPLDGLHGVLRVGAENRVLEASLHTPQGAAPALAEFLAHVRQALSLLVLPIPDAPVGVAAKYRGSREVDIRGIELREQVTVSVDSLSDDSAELSFESTGGASPQSISPPDLPPGARCELISARASSRGRVTTAIGAALPTRGSVRLDLELEMRVVEDGDAQVVRSQVRVEYQVTAGED